MNRNITIPEIEVETFIDQAEHTRKSLQNTLDIMKQLGTEIENEKKTSVEGSTTAVQTNNTIAKVQRSCKYKCPTSYNKIWALWCFLNQVFQI